MFPTQISCSCVDKGERQSSIWVVKWKRPGSRRTTPNTARMREAYAIKVPENKPMSAWQRSEGPACCEVQALYGQGLLLEWELPWSGRVENLDLAVKNLESWAGYEHLSPCCLKTKLFWLKGHALVHRKTNLGMHVFGEKASGAQCSGRIFRFDFPSFRLTWLQFFSLVLLQFLLQLLPNQWTHFFFLILFSLVHWQLGYPCSWMW